MINDKDIWKLADEGLTVEQIARKIGPPEYLQRVRDSLERQAAERQKIRDHFTPVEPRRRSSER